MAASREILTIDAFTMFGMTDQAQDAATSKLDGESIPWPQAAVVLRTQ